MLELAPFRDLIEKEMTDTQINLASMQEKEFDFDELLDFVRGYLKTPVLYGKKRILRRE